MAASCSSNTECPICLGQIRNPVRSSCCGQNFCTACTQGLVPPGRCPYCRTNEMFFRPVPIRQPPHRPQPTPQPRPTQPYIDAVRYHCLATDCNFSSASGQDFLTHLFNVHGEHVLAHHHLMFQGDTDGFRGVQRDTPDNNRFVSNTKMGPNGKTYCGGRLNGPACICCDGVCGPESGCNCIRCMTMDLINFGINQGNSLLNKYGRVSSRSSETGKFYCAAILDISDTDPTLMTNCGPLEGPNCEACRVLDEQSLGRYASLVM